MAVVDQPRRMLLITLLAAGLGLLGGAAGWVLLHLIALITNLALFGRFAFVVPSFADLHVGPHVVLVAAAGAFAVSVLARWAPVIRGHGIPEAMEAILEKQSRISPRAALAKPLSAAIAIGTGGPFGAEGPIIVTGGALGSLIGQVVPVSPAERKILLASGAAAGMAATFGTPVAAVFLPIELLVFEFSTRALIPLVVASTLATGVHNLVIGTGPLFPIPPHEYTRLSALPFYALLGIGCGLLAVIINKGLFWTESVYRRLPISEFWHPVIGAVAFATIGLTVPRALGVGYDAIGDTLAGRLTVAAMAVLLVGKLVVWWIALGSGTSGGTLAPVLLVSACFGGLVGSGIDAILPGTPFAIGSFALVAMAATFGAATRATLTSIVFVFEVTRDYQAILPLMLAAVIADFIAAALLDQSLMTEKLARRGIQVHTEYEVDILRTIPVHNLMTRQVDCIPVDATVEEARRRFQTTKHGAYPVVDEQGGLAGIVARRDILRSTDIPEDAPVMEIATPQVVTVSPGDMSITALSAMLEGGFGHVPVCEDGRVVGMVTRADVVRSRLRQMELERRQPGWRPRWPRDVFR